MCIFDSSSTHFDIRNQTIEGAVCAEFSQMIYGDVVNIVVIIYSIVEQW